MDKILFRIDGVEFDVPVDPKLIPGWNRDRCITIDERLAGKTGIGVGTYEHVDEDSQGNWIYADLDTW